MGKFFRNLLILLLILATYSQFYIANSNAADPNSYTTFRTVDKNTFNEYRYLITKEFFSVVSSWKVDWNLDPASLARLKDLAIRGANYLPDNNLENEFALNNLKDAISKSLKYNRSQAAYKALYTALGAFLDETAIESITWEVVALPKEWNAPFNVTLRASVNDPTGTTIPKYNYVWWMDLGSRKVNIWTGPSINYTFKEEWNFTVFVDITSAHKNGKWYSDVIPYRWEVIVKVKEKIASLIVKVNWDRLGTREELKFTPTQAKYWLLFDATSSIPTWSARFIRTEWDFWNGIKKKYSWAPKIERIVYSREGDYEVSLLLKTNLNKTIEKKFTISIHDPIATINVTPEEWFLGDKFTMSAKNVTNDDNLIYNWTIIDIIEDKVVFSKQTKLFTYNFPNKGHFNIKLEVNGIDSGNKNIDTKNIYINSRAPVANFTSSIPELNKPNRILLDATDSFDPDFTDTGKLKYYWEIDWARVNLEDPNDNGSLWYYTFSTIWDHNVVLKVEDLDNIEWVKKSKVTVSSVLSVDFSSNPRAIKRWQRIVFEATSPNAEFFEWDFGDWNKSTGWVEKRITHKYEKVGIFTVKLKVLDESGKSNIYSKVIYVWNWTEPVAILNVWNSLNNVSIEKNWCNWKDAYLVDRITAVNFDSWDSINIDWKNSWIDYSLKVWNNKYYTSRNITHKFDELGCTEVILKVTSQDNHSTDTEKVWIKVQNINPTLSSLTTTVENLESDPVIVTVNAIWATDKDGVITSYLWYYYTDLDNEPQDFRSTVSSSTKFVLPKITWNYYFVVLLSDDTESRVSSEELWKKASLTLAWDNINVPIVELKTNDNSVHVFDEVVLTAKVQNILKQDLSKKVKYFWDYDGDWFYDKETKVPLYKHSYDKPGTYYAKLKVKYKGFSNTRNIEINVANSLVPKFDYISIWNKFIFINKTTWSYENISWDLWDWTKINNEDYIEHSYTDGKSSHIIKLVASDWNKVKRTENKVVKNFQNLLKYKKSSVWVLFSTPESDSNNVINIDERWINLTIYYAWDSKDFSEIAADTDLNKDTDLNWWKDDDINILSTEYSYLNIELDKKKTQIIRVFVKDSDWVVIVSKDYKIIKNYIKNEEIDLGDIVFVWVTNYQKQQLEELKNMVSWIPWDDWRLAKIYISRLKDEWNDENERTKIIYEFDWFLNDSEIQNKNDIVDKLHELLLKETDDANEKNVALRALQWSTPANIQCEFESTEYDSCKVYIDSSLETIRNNDDVEQNKALGKIILDIIWKDSNLSTEQKLDYKATLQILIYGSVDNIPPSDVSTITDPEEEGSMISTILKTIWYILWWIIILFGLWMLWMFIYHKFSNKDKDKSFEDFIVEKTNIKDDVFSSDKKEDKKEKIEKKDDIFSETKTEEIKLDPIKKNEEIKDLWNKKEERIETKAEDVPDWLKWSFDATEAKSSSEDSISKQKEPKKEIEKKEEVTKKSETKKEEIKKEEVTKKPEQKIETKKPELKKEEVKKTEVKKVEQKKEESLEEITKVDDDNIPDWLKWSIDDTPKKEEKKSSSQPSPLKEKEQEQKIEKKVATKKVDDDNIPDWLKWSFDDIPEKEEKVEVKKPEAKKEEKPETKIEDKKQIIKPETKKEEKTAEIKQKVEPKKDASKKPAIKKEEITEKKSEKKESKTETKKTEWKKPATKNTSEKKSEEKSDKKLEDKKQVTKADSKKAEEKKVSVKNKKEVSKKEVSKKDETKKEETKNDATSDLWDDGMDIPDWLKN